MHSLSGKHAMQINNKTEQSNVQTLSIRLGVLDTTKKEEIKAV